MLNANLRSISFLLLAATSLLAGCLTSGETDEPAGGQNPGGSTNGSPTISGTPPTAVLIGESYDFTPNASDPDGDSLSFSIQNQPRWATFDPNSGHLTGVPNLGDEGSYGSIRITVSDGSSQASLPQFAVNVTQSADGAATLSWTAPTQNSDGSALTDLAGYMLYYGTSQGSYPNQIRIDNPGITTYVVENLTPNTYYFVSTALNTSGVESDYSNVATKVVN